MITSPATVLKLLVIILTIATYLVIPSPSIAAEKIAFTLPNNPSPLGRKEGYLLIDLQSQNPRILLKVRRMTKKAKQIPGRHHNRLISKEITLSLNNLDAGLYLATMSAGSYQITEVSVPFYDLPFRLDVSEKKRWQFKVEAKKINYLGHLYVNNERSVEDVEIKLSNQFATNYDNIYAQVILAYEELPLTFSQRLPDDYYSELSRKLAD